MGSLHVTVGGVDMSSYFKEGTFSPGGDGRQGTATLYFDKEAAGLDIRAMMVVQVWEDFDGAGNGVATRGRLFGGLVRNRDTSNIGTTKTWSLSCDDFNLIGTRGLVRDMQEAKAITLTAGTFKAQVTELTQIIQRNGAITVNTEINTTDAVVVDYASMPAVTYEGGHTYFWYLGMLCATLVELSPAVRPTYYLGTGITVGASEDFGPPTLYILDKANPPSPAFEFSDSPTGSEHPIYPAFSRKSQSNEMIQRVQVRTAAQVYTGVNTTAQTTYPNPYINHGGASDTGYWMVEPLPAVTTAQDPQAIVDRKVESAGFPRDSYSFDTDQRPRNGEYVTLTWDLEGLSAVDLQVVETQYRIEPPLEVWCTVTLNARRLRFGQSAEDDIYAPPVEGDIVPPLPPQNFVLVSNIYNPTSGKTELTFEWDASPSADTQHYEILGYGAEGGYRVKWKGNNDTTEATIDWEPGVVYTIVARAVDTSRNEGLYTDPPLTGTAATEVHTLLPNGSFEFLDRIDLTKPRYWDRVNSGGGTSVIEETEVRHGQRSLKLTTGGTVGDIGGVITNFVVAEGDDSYRYELRLVAKASVAGTPLFWTTTFYDEDGVGIDSRNGSFTLTTDWAAYTAEVSLEAAGVQMKLQLRLNQSTAATAYVDNVSLSPQTVTTGYSNESVTEVKLSPTAQASLRAEVSLVDRARLASGWNDLGALTSNAFREADIMYDADASLYRVFYTGVFETTRTDVRSASTPEGIVGATPVTNIAPVKYPSVQYDTATGIWHLWGTRTTPSITTAHYTSTSPTSGYTFSDTLTTAIIDCDVKKHPTNGYWYAIGFTNDPPGPSTLLRLLRAAAPEGPWTDMGNVFADSGFPPFATNARPDPNLALGVDGRDYIIYSASATTMLAGYGYGVVHEIDLTTARVIGSPAMILDDREAWIPALNGVNDHKFLRVPGENDRIFAFVNDGGVAGNYHWGYIELQRAIAPDDGRRTDDLVRIDPDRGTDVASGLRPVLISGAEWVSDGLLVRTSGGAAQGYPAVARLDDFTMIVEFTPRGTQGSPSVIAYVGGSSYSAGPIIQITASADALGASITATDTTNTTLTSGITLEPGKRYRVAIRKSKAEVKMWVNGTLVDTDTHAAASNFTGLQVWTLGGQKTLTQAFRYPFVGTIHAFTLVGTSLPLKDVTLYPALQTEGDTFPASPYTGQRFYRTDLHVDCQYDGTRWLGPEKSITFSDRNTVQPFTTGPQVIAEYRIRSGHTIWLKAWAVSTHVTTTNNGTNYWQVNLLKASDATNIVSVNTAGDAPDTWVQKAEVTTFPGNPFTPASVAGFAVEVAKTLSPGNIYMDQELIYQEVYT